MKQFVIFVSVCIVAVINVGGQTCKYTKTGGGVTLEVATRDINGSKNKFGVVLTNNLDERIYVASNPIRVDGSAGPYISQSNSPSQVVIESRVYEPTYPPPYNPATIVSLIAVDPGGSFVLDMSISWPLMETVPPINLEFRKKQIDRENVETIQFAVGYFIEETELLKLLERKAFGWTVSGSELIRSSNIPVPLYKVQQLVSTTISLN
jgi:hypothetical protein